MDNYNNERIQTLNDIITGIARRNASKFLDLEVDDLSQEMWKEVLTTENRVGHPLDLDYIATICYNTVVDLQRYGMKRNAYSTDELVEDPEWSPFREDFDSKIMVDDLLELFPPDSLEGVFLRYWATASNVKDYGYRPSDETTKRNGSSYKDGYTDSNLAKMLGFKGTGDRGYKKFKNNMKVIVINYLGSED